jgi:hypothetical protein
VTAFANSYQVILYTLLSEALIAIGAVVDLQRIARAIFVTKAAFMAVQHKAGFTLGFPRGGTDVAFISGAVHKASLPSHAVPGLVPPGRAEKSHAIPDWALPGLALWIGPRCPGVVPCRALPISRPAHTSRVLSSRAPQSLSLPCSASSCLERNAKACLSVGSSQLAEGCAGSSTDKQAFAYDVQTTKYPVKHPSALPVYHGLERLSRCKILQAKA